MRQRTFRLRRDITVPAFGSIKKELHLPAGSVVTASEGNRGYWFVSSAEAPSLVMSVRKSDLELVSK